MDFLNLRLIRVNPYSEKDKCDRKYISIQKVFQIANSKYKNLFSVRVMFAGAIRPHRCLHDAIYPTHAARESHLARSRIYTRVSVLFSKTSRVSALEEKQKDYYRPVLCSFFFDC